MLREMTSLLPNENAQDVTTSLSTFESPEPTALYYNRDVIFEKLDLDTISENALVIHGDLKVNTVLINAEIDINTTLVVLGNVYAKILFVRVVKSTLLKTSTLQATLSPTTITAV